MQKEAKIMAGDPVKKAVATASDLPRNHVATVRAEAGRLKRLRVSIERQRKGLFGLEQDAAAEFDEALRRLKIEEADAAERAAFSGALKEIRLKVLSLEVFGWRRKKDGLPSLAIFGLDSPVCKFSAARRQRYNDWGVSRGTANSFVTTPILPKPLRVYYDDIAKLLQRRRSSGQRLASATISVRFAGVIPPATREKIRKSLPVFDQVFILAEAPDWKATQRRRRVKPVPMPIGDPLVVGYKAGQLFLIDTFDTTPVENYIAQEFTT